MGQINQLLRLHMADALAGIPRLVDEVVSDR
jgi:hypothetical protein